MKRGMEPFVVLNRTIYSKSVTSHFEIQSANLVEKHNRAIVTNCLF